MEGMDPTSFKTNLNAESTAPFLCLPAELVDAVLSDLSPEDLARTARTCQLLRNHASKDIFWEAFLQTSVPFKIPPPDLGTYRDLFLAHYPHWFLTRHKIWFGNLPINGKLILARFDPRRSCIEAFNIAAKRGSQESGIICWDGVHVEYDSFNPIVKLDFTSPVMRLAPSNVRQNPYKFEHALSMDLPVSSTAPIRKTFLHTRSLDPSLSKEPSIQLWPPRLLPSPGSQRVRTQSSKSFRSSGHIPAFPSQVSDSTFRIRHTTEFSHMPINLIRFLGPLYGAEQCDEYGTLPREAYKPTSEKPWQGIWVGDYNAHGCEFLAIIQPDDPLPLPPKAQQALSLWPIVSPADARPLLSVADIVPKSDESGRLRISNSFARRGSRPIPGLSKEEAPYCGRLEAVKLTGDPNVPRGEYSFIVPDLGENGLIRCTKDSLFQDALTKESWSDVGGTTSAAAAPPLTTALPGRMAEGARVVRGIGHVAWPGFANDTYIPSEIILVSEDRLAQYWKSFEHISFYQRVDIDALLKYE